MANKVQYGRAQKAQPHRATGKPGQAGDLGGKVPPATVARHPSPGITSTHRGGMHRPVGATEQTPTAAPVPGVVEPAPLQNE